MLMKKKKCLQRVVCQGPGALCMYMYMTIIFKYMCIDLVSQSQTLCGALLGRGNESLYKCSRSHDSMAINNKNI